MLHLWIDLSGLDPDVRAEVERAVATASGGVFGTDSGLVRAVHRRGAVLELEAALTIETLREAVRAGEVGEAEVAAAIEDSAVHAGCVAQDELDDEIRQAEDNQRSDDAAEVAQILEHLAKLADMDGLRAYLARVEDRRQDPEGRWDALRAALGSV